MSAGQRITDVRLAALVEKYQSAAYSHSEQTRDVAVLLLELQVRRAMEKK